MIGKFMNKVKLKSLILSELQHLVSIFSEQPTESEINSTLKAWSNCDTAAVKSMINEFKSEKVSYFTSLIDAISSTDEEQTMQIIQSLLHVSRMTDGYGDTHPEIRKIELNIYKYANEYISHGKNKG